MTRGGRGVHQKMTDDGDGMEEMVEDEKNHQKCPIIRYEILQPWYIVLLGHILIIFSSTLGLILI